MSNRQRTDLAWMLNFVILAGFMSVGGYTFMAVANYLFFIVYALRFVTHREPNEK